VLTRGGDGEPEGRPDGCPLGHRLAWVSPLVAVCDCKQSHIWRWEPASPGRLRKGALRVESNAVARGLAETLSAGDQPAPAQPEQGDKDMVTQKNVAPTGATGTPGGAAGIALDAMLGIAGSDGVVVRDPHRERRLEKSGLAFRLIADYPLDKINISRSRAGQRRLDLAGRTDPDLVVDYALAMERGSQFPPLVLRSRPAAEGGPYLLDGMHRFDACQLNNRRTHPAYLVEVPDDREADALERSLNFDNGWRPDKADKPVQALQWMQTHGASITETAARFGLKRDQLQNAWNEAFVRRTLGEHGIRPEGIPASAIQRLYQFRSELPVFLEIGRLTLNRNLRGIHLDGLIDDLRRCRSQEDRLRTVQAFREKPEIKSIIERKLVQPRHGGAGSGPVVVEPHHVKPVRDRFLRYLRQARNILDRYPDFNSLQLSLSEDRQQAAELVDEISAAWGRLAEGAAPRAS